MVCPNVSCINKSTVYRKLTDKIRQPNCKLCGHELVRTINKLSVKQDIKAKQELKELESHNAHL